MGGEPQRDFDVGGLAQKEINLNADFSYPISDNINFAFGGEWREETFSMKAGEPNSFVGGGTSGFTGIKANKSFSRNNYAVYADIEQDISDDFMIQYAGRYEHFSDFGSTINGKLAARYRVSDMVTLRGAISTGFHAPTPGQSNFTSTITTFNVGGQVEEGLIPSTDPVAVALGGLPLTEEKSINYSLGFTSSVGDNSTLTVDVYQIDVDDKIYRTGNLPVVGAPGASISFYTNALDIRSKGVDVVFTSNFDWSSNVTTDLSFAFNYNKYSVRGQKIVNTPDGPVTPVGESTLDDIQNAYPKTRFVLSSNTIFNDNWNFMARANYYGSHVDERGDQGGGGAGFSTELGASIFFDVEIGYQINDNFKLVAGAANVFNSYVDETGLDNASYRGNGLQYPRWSAANYEGGSWYLKASYTF